MAVAGTWQATVQNVSVGCTAFLCSNKQLAPILSSSYIHSAFYLAVASWRPIQLGHNKILEQGGYFSFLLLHQCICIDHEQLPLLPLHQHHLPLFTLGLKHTVPTVGRFDDYNWTRGYFIFFSFFFFFLIPSSTKFATVVKILIMVPRISGEMKGLLEVAGWLDLRWNTKIMMRYFLSNERHLRGQSALKRYGMAGNDPLMVGSGWCILDGWDQSRGLRMFVCIDR